MTTESRDRRTRGSSETKPKSRGAVDSLPEKQRGRPRSLSNEIHIDRARSIVDNVELGTMPGGDSSSKRTDFARMSDTYACPSSLLVDSPNRNEGRKSNREANRPSLVDSRTMQSIYGENRPTSLRGHSFAKGFPKASRPSTVPLNMGSKGEDDSEDEFNETKHGFDRRETLDAIGDYARMSTRRHMEKMKPDERASIMSARQQSVNVFKTLVQGQHAVDASLNPERSLSNYSMFQRIGHGGVEATDLIKLAEGEIKHQQDVVHDAKVLLVKAQDRMDFWQEALDNARGPRDTRENTPEYDQLGDGEDWTVTRRVSSHTQDKNGYYECCLHNVRFYLIEADDPVGKVIDSFLLFCNLWAVVMFVLDIEYKDLEYKEGGPKPEDSNIGIFNAMEYLLTAIFGIEYILRAFADPSKYSMGYIASTWGMVDLLSVLPSLIDIVYKDILAIKDQEKVELGFLRILRCLRVFKFFRYLEDHQRVADTFIDITPVQLQIVRFGFTITVALFMACGLFLAVEEDTVSLCVPHSKRWDDKGIEQKGWQKEPPERYSDGHCPEDAKGNPTKWINGPKRILQQFNQTQTGSPYQVKQRKRVSWLFAIYFTVVSFSTVGYGDVSPLTEWGRIVVVIIIIIMMGVLPTESAKLVNAMNKEVEEEEPRHNWLSCYRLNCNLGPEHIHDNDALYCKKCGNLLMSIDTREVKLSRLKTERLSKNPLKGH